MGTGPHRERSVVRTSPWTISNPGVPPNFSRRMCGQGRVHFNDDHFGGALEELFGERAAATADFDR